MNSKDSNPAPFFGAIEGGGTKFVCGFGKSHDRIETTERIETSSPEQTLKAVCAFFQKAPPLKAIGLGMFGPLNIKANENFGAGTTLRTPKPGWDFVPVKTILEETLNVPVVLDTDVNGAALAEHRWGAAKGCNPAVYVTVGTGVGAGVIFENKPLHGLLHPEFGHMPVPVLDLEPGKKDDFPCQCPFHEHCIEGVASGSAFSKRCNHDFESLGKNHPFWNLEARYLAQALAACTYMLSPERIVIGGGMLKNPGMLEAIQRSLRDLVAGYIPHKDLNENIASYLVYPHFGQQAGLVGAFALAESSV